jgi:hypothetical protein
MSFVLAYTCACSDHQGEVRARIGDPQERAAYIEFLKSRNQAFKELSDGTIVATPGNRSDAEALDQAVRSWQQQRVEHSNAARDATPPSK